MPTFNEFLHTEAARRHCPGDIYTQLIANDFTYFQEIKKWAEATLPDRWWSDEPLVTLWIEYLMTLPPHDSTKNKVAPVYQPELIEKRKSAARHCLRGGNQNRVSFATEIITGDLFNDDGYPRNYWHCTATIPPPPPRGRRGQWKPTPMGSYRGEWVWQDWGPERKGTFIQIGPNHYVRVQ